MPGWRCQRCASDVDDGFEVCWSCGASRGGEADPAFATAESAPVADDDATPVVIERAEATGASSEVDRPPPPARTCGSCGAALERIQLIDRTKYGDDQLRYAAGDAKPGFWFGYSTAGVVSAFACPSCGHIDLFAVPDEPV